MGRIVCMLLMCLSANIGWAQIGGQGGGAGGGAGGQGGVFVDAEGVLRLGKAPKGRSDQKAIDQRLEIPADLRRISLRQVHEQLLKLAEKNEEIPLDLMLLGGLNRISFVVIDRAKQDVYLVGPAEAFIEHEGRYVAKSSHRPCVRLDDLREALACVLRGRGEVVCSMDPQPKGLAEIKKYDIPIAKNKAEAEKVKKEIFTRIDKQTVRTAGVRDGSRFALTMIEADYQMKRLALGLIKNPAVTSHLDALSTLNLAGELNSNMARWWFTPGYERVEANSDKTVFRMVGPALRIQNEEVAFDQDGNRTGLGRSNPDWDKFADSFNKNTPKLESTVASFADLHNLFDLMMVAAIIKQQKMGGWIAGSTLCDLSSNPKVTQPAFAEPCVSYRFDRKKVDATSSRLFFTVAFGGVSMNPGKVLGSSSGAATQSMDGSGEKLAQQLVTKQSSGTTGSAIGSKPKALTKGADGEKPALTDDGTPTSPAANREPSWWSDVVSEAKEPSRE